MCWFDAPFEESICDRSGQSRVLHLKQEMFSLNLAVKILHNLSNVYRLLLFICLIYIRINKCVCVSVVCAIVLMTKGIQTLSFFKYIILHSPFRFHDI